MKHLKYAALLLFAMGMLLTACNKDDETPVGVSTETVELKIRNMWEYGNFQLNTNYTHPITGDDFMFDTLKYYISNVRLKNADGSWWVHPNSYFLVNMEDTNTTLLKLTDVPYGVYTTISYMVGVDSTIQQAGGTFTGALASSNKMRHIVADSGVYMLKAFGTSPDAPIPGNFAYYLHGYEGPHAIMREVVHGFGEVPMTITQKGDYRVSVRAYVNAIWNTTGSVAATPAIAYYGPEAKQMARDFFTSFAFDSISE